MTEDEAKTKWCPFVRRVIEGGTFNRGCGNSINDHSDNEGTICNCIGSACAVWRWTIEKTEIKPILASRAYKTVQTDNGYCGLAGKP